MKCEFRVGDVIYRIGKFGKNYVFGADDGFYYISNLETGIPFALPQIECESKYVKGGRMKEQEAHEYENKRWRERNWCSDD